MMPPETDTASALPLMTRDLRTTRIIQKKLRRYFDYLIIDEVHEQKSDESAQSMACGKLIASVPHTLALTGTIIGGYANHLFPLLIRLNPRTLRDEGYEWGKDLAFTETYGRIDRILTTADKAIGVDVMTKLHNEMGPKSVTPDLAGLWRDLGLKPQGESLAFDDTAPLAEIRKAITAPRAK